MADTALPKALSALSTEHQQSVTSWMEEMLKEWGSPLSDKDYEHLEKNYNLSKSEGEEIAKFVEESKDIMPVVDLETRFIKISKSKYELGRVLGSGKYAQVRRGRNVQTRKMYALKILYVDGTKREVRMLREQIRDELKAFKKLKNTENVVRLHAFDCRGIKISEKNKKERPAYIQVQELCSKGELYEYVQYNGSFSEELARTVFHQFINGLAECHRHGIVHRDLKPDNILVDHNYTVKICDFGFSKIYEQDGKTRQMHTVLGTQGYMSPEMLLKLAYGPKTDIFSAGVILFILLAGYPPLQTAEIGDWWFERLLEGRYHKFWQAHEQGDKRFSVEAKKLIIGMLEPNPAERYSVEDVQNSDWFNLRLMDGDEYRKTMSKMKDRVDRKRAKETSATTRDTELGTFRTYVKKQGPAFKPQLQRLVENKFIQDLNSVDSEKSLLKTLRHIQRESKSNIKYDLTKALKMKDPVECARTLAEAKDLDAVRKVLDLGDDDTQNLFQELQPMRNSEVDFALMAMDYRIGENIFDSINVKIPELDSDLHHLPLTTYKLTCGFDILNFAVRFLIKSRGQARMNVKRATATTELMFDIVKKVDLPSVEDSEADEAAAAKEKRAREALGLSLPSQTTKGVQSEIKKKLKMQIQCFREPGTGNLVACCSQMGTVSEKQAVAANFMEIVNYLFSETILAVFLADSDPRPEPMS